MQLLKYMACIWAEYEKTFLSERGKISKNKSFKYPPIIPVVYYEGKKEWTADMYLRDRIMFSDILRPYIPDFKYIVVRNHDFSDEELLAREDEMSLLMLINKFQTADDITNFRDIEKDKIDSIIHNSSDQVIDIIAAVVRSLCTKIHISAEETDDAVQKVREHKLGYLFENMEKIDIQQLRKEAEDITPDYPNLKELIANMFETMNRADGVGLAAPQIGLPIRVVTIDLDVMSDELPEFKDFRRAYINPHILEVGGEEVSMEEGCLSLPGIHETVKRPDRIHVTYLDEELKEHDEWVEGYLARVMQHEFDHLDGKMFIDHLSALRKQMIKGKLGAMLKGKARCSYKVKTIK